MTSPSMFTKSILVTGATRGIGHELVCQLLKMKNGPKHVFAGCRDPSLARFQERDGCGPTLHILQQDVTNISQLNASRDRVSEVVGNDGLNVIINNAGIYCGIGLLHQTEKQLIQHFQTNAVGPLLVTRVFHSLLKKAAKKIGCENNDFSLARAAVINLTSLSSTFLNEDVKTAENYSYSYAYDSSKAALNFCTFSLAEELGHDGIGILGLYPGWVQTDLGGCNATLSPKISVLSLLETMKSKMNQTNSGSLFDYQGAELNY